MFPQLPEQQVPSRHAPDYGVQQSETGASECDRSETSKSNTSTVHKTVLLSTPSRSISKAATPTVAYSDRQAVHDAQSRVKSSQEGHGPAGEELVVAHRTECRTRRACVDNVKFPPDGWAASSSGRPRFGDRLEPRLMQHHPAQTSVPN